MCCFHLLSRRGIPVLFNNLNSLLQFSTQPNSDTSTKPIILRKCIALLQSCASSLYKLKQIHAFSLKRDVPISCPDMGKHLIFFAVTHSPNADPSLYPYKIFSQILYPNVFTWNTLIRAYADSENPAPAVSLYAQMNVEPDTHTYPFLLKAVSRLLDIKTGKTIHSILVRNGLDGLVFVQNALVHLYSACGVVESAHKVFDSMPVRNLVTWNSVINGYALNGRPNEVLTLFKEMSSLSTSLESEGGVQPDGFTMVSLLSACGELGALALGRRVHVYMVKVGLSTENLHAGNALIDLYAKCGRVTEAEMVFCQMRERSVVSWTSLINGLAVNGFGDEAIKLFQEMEREAGLVPTEITLVGVLYACSHCGKVREGFQYFDRMWDEYGIEAKVEHYGCMVDLLGRAGRVKEAYEFIQNMPFPPNAVIWRTLLGACTIKGNREIAEVARLHLMELEPKHSGDYVLLSNLYAAEKRWTDVQRVRRMMYKEGVRKTPGLSVVELRNRVYEFTMGDRSHPLDNEIYEMLEEMTKRLRLEGYVPGTENVLADIQDEEKETALRYHSEKIAIAFVLISTPPKTPITVIKNLRVCADCHLAIKLVSRIFERLIIVRDRSRFHHFSDGSCSCNDYW